VRPWHSLVGLMLLVAPLGARAQQPASLDEPCSVSANQRWTPQEKFVWERICAGKDADFNSAPDPDYGGNLDPKKPDGWPKKRVLRPDFLQTILLKDPYRRALTQRGVIINGARFIDAIDLENAELQHPLTLSTSLIEKGANLVGLRSKYPIVFSGSKVTGVLSMSRMDLDATLLMRNKGEFAEVNLVNAHVGGELNLTGSKFTGKLNMNGLQGRGNLLMHGGAEFAELDLTAAHIRAVTLNDSKVIGKLTCFALEVDLVMYAGAAFDGPADFRAAHIKGDLYLTGGDFEKDVDFTGAEIGGSLVLNAVQWSPGVTLTFRNAKIGLIPDLADAWAPKLNIDGFTYQGVEDARQFETWFATMSHYASQPYDQLASVVQRQGDRTLATSIRYAGRERERNEAAGGEWAWLTTLKWVIGYGYYPERAGLWAIGLVFAGVIVLRISGEGPRNGMPFGLAYSFDILLPLVRLRDRHYGIDLKSWARYYFYWHKIMGYVLASFLIAGLSGLTK
jgi:hypothetical protein